MTNRYIAVIPARAGSKGLPGKNKMILAGKPLVLHTLDSALEAKVFDSIIVSTDDEGIIELLDDKKYRSICSDVRPEKLARDNTEMYEVLYYLINKYDLPDDCFLTLLQPTSPLRDSMDIIQAIKKLENSDLESLVSVVESDNTVLKSCFLDNDLLRGIHADELLFKNRQSLPKVYKPNGAIYIYKIGAILANHGFYLNQTISYIMDKEKSLDIDNLHDFKKLEGVLK